MVPGKPEHTDRLSTLCFILENILSIEHIVLSDQWTMISIIER